MENFKFNLMVIIVFIVLGGIVYWSVSSMNNNVYYTRNIEEEEPVNSEIVIETPEDSVTEEPDETPAIVKTNEEYSELIAKIEKLISDKIYMKNGSQGTRVGMIQEFLNIYSETDKKIDNDYGPGTTSSVKEFQQEEGLVADGQTGPDTYRAMIDWLNSN